MIMGLRILLWAWRCHVCGFGGGGGVDEGGECGRAGRPLLSTHPSLSHPPPITTTHHPPVRECPAIIITYNAAATRRTQVKSAREGGVGHGIRPLGGAWSGGSRWYCGVCGVQQCRVSRRWRGRDGWGAGCALWCAG